MKITTIILICTTIFYVNAQITSEQLAKMGEIFKRICAPKHKMTKEQLEKIKNGDFPDDKNTKCYISCLYTKANIWKHRKFNYDTAKSQIEKLFPEDRKPEALMAISNCKDIGATTKDQCQATYDSAKCLYKWSPELFSFR